jgi:hypothetical protein
MIVCTTRPGRLGLLVQNKQQERLHTFAGLLDMIQQSHQCLFQKNMTAY